MMQVSPILFHSTGARVRRDDGLKCGVSHRRPTRWSPPFMLRFAHNRRPGLLVVPVLAHMSCKRRRNMLAEMRRLLRTSLSVFPATRPRNIMDSSLVNAGVNRNPGVSPPIILGRSFIPSSFSASPRSSVRNSSCGFLQARSVTQLSSNTTRYLPHPADLRWFCRRRYKRQPPR
jgi:hypothetical protein